MTERRYDPTSREWVTVATHRQNRTYKPADFCPLCPTRAGSEPTEIPYESFEVVTFDNLFPSFTPVPPAPDLASTALFPVRPAAGRCEVLVYSDDHRATFADLPPERVRTLVDVWADRYAVLGAEPTVGYVMPFENKGEAMGTTLAHPHGQIYGYPEIPPRPRRELEAAGDHRVATGRCLECDVVAAELADGRRVVAVRGDWVAWVPFWARFPYELHVAPSRHRPSLVDLDTRDGDQMASLLSAVARCYDGLWGFSLPYVMAFHQEPTDGGDWAELAHLHVEFTPLHRTADRLKYLAGSELAGGAFVTDVAPEQAAARLRSVIDQHDDGPRRPAGGRQPGQGGSAGAGRSPSPPACPKPAAVEVPEADLASRRARRPAGGHRPPAPDPPPADRRPAGRAARGVGADHSP